MTVCSCNAGRGGIVTLFGDGFCAGGSEEVGQGVGLEGADAESTHAVKQRRRAAVRSLYTSMPSHTPCQQQ